MPAQCVEVADLLTAHINTFAGLPAGLTASRLWIPYKRRNVTALTICVVVDLRVLTVEARGKDKNEHNPLVIIQSPIDPKDNTEADTIAELTEEIEKHVLRFNLSDNYRWKRQTETILNEDWLSDSGCFWSAFQPGYEFIA